MQTMRLRKSFLYVSVGIDREVETLVNLRGWN